MSAGSGTGAPGAILEGRGLAKRFGAVTALADVDIAIAPGEFFALLGPSGCGKTTLLRIFAGFETPDRGAVLLEGADITALRPNRRPLNMMFQSYALFPHMTVARNVAYGLEMERRGEDEIRQRVGDILTVTGLAALADRRPGELSGGQRQRVALARALVKKPKVLLLDEPLSALDKGLREQMQVELKRTQKEAGIAFVIVTHDQEEALGLADRLAVLEHGCIRQIGTPREVYDRPADRFVAGFVGENNIFDLPAAGEPEGPARWLLARLAGSGATGARPAMLCVRPERWQLGREPGEGLAARVVATVFHGSELKVLLEARQGGAPLLARLSAAEAERVRPAAGEELWCQVVPEHIRAVPAVAPAGVVPDPVARGPGGC